MQQLSPPPIPAQPHAPPSALRRMDADRRAEFWASLILRHTQGLGMRSCKRLLEYFGNAREAVRNPHGWPAAKVSREKAAPFASGSWRALAHVEWEKARRLDAEILLWQDRNYPLRLRELPDAPPLLYCRGDTRLLQAPCVAIVGSRDCSPEGASVARGIAGQLSAGGIAVVSGLAIGIDRQAHLAALRHHGGTVAVLGTGIDVAYPRSNAKLFAQIAAGGLILTEFMPSSPPDARHFPTRNRLISGLSLGVLIVEAAHRSGSLITARLALEQNREVYAIPGPVSAEISAGCRELIRQGAQPVFSAEDILRDLAPQLLAYSIPQPGPIPAGREKESSAAIRAMPPREPPPEDAPEGDSGCIVRILREKGPCHIDDLARQTELHVSRLSSLLLRLELQALVLRLPGMRYKASVQTGKKNPVY